MLDLNKYSHSDDVLELLPTLKPPLVRKTFKTNLNRVKANVDKQRTFGSFSTGSILISAAPVIDFKINNETAELLMPYVHGVTGHMFPLYATRKMAQSLSSSLSALLSYELGVSRIQKFSITIFQEKLTQVSNSTQYPDLKGLINKCINIVSKFPSELSFPIGLCHGDLTLSNLILDPFKNITLIDFLYTFLESPLQDVAKIKQDYVYGWSFRYDSSALRVRAKIFCSHHFPEAVIKIDKEYPIQVYLLTLIALARIAPYVKDATTQQWLVCSLTECLRDSPL